MNDLTNLTGTVVIFIGIMFGMLATLICYVGYRVDKNAIEIKNMLEEGNKK